MWDEGEPYYIAYDEIYVPRLDAYQLAARVSERHSGQFFEQFSRTIVQFLRHDDLDDRVQVAGLVRLSIDDAFAAKP